MHPAFSVIFLTTLIGAGQGLFLALITGQVYSVANLLPPQDGRTFYAAGSLLVLVLLVLGLLASFFHLGRPERAWRAAAQWRTSWLSREVIVLPVFLLLVFFYGVLHFTGWTPVLFTLREGSAIDLSLMLGLVAGLAAFLLYISTAMIYASLRFLQEWHHWLTVANYLLFGLASGFTLAAAFSAWQGVNLVGFFVTWAVIFTGLALITRGASLYRNARLKYKSTVQSAIGVRHTRVQQRSMGFMGGSFNTREFFHGGGPAALRTVRLLFLLLVFIAPVVMLGVAWARGSAILPLAAFAVQYVGLLFERWYFFAEAKHPQNLYYQSAA
jgi:DMSO reductase anchor subunit